MKTFWRYWMLTCTVAVTLGLLGGMAYFAYGLIPPARQDKAEIEACLDSGGAWNDEADTCVHAS